MKQQSLKILLKEETGPYELPKGWRWVRLGEMCKINKNSRNPAKEIPDKEFLYIDITSVEGGTGEIKEIKKILGENAPSRARRVIHQDDVIMSTVRPYLKAFAVIPPEYDNQICSTGFAVLSCNSGILPKFLLYALFSEVVIEQCNKMMIGAHYPALNNEQVSEIKIPLPSLPEQKRIVARIEALFSKIDEIKRLRKEANDLAKTLMPSALHEVFSKADEKGWRWVRLGSICLVRGGKRLPKGDKFSAVPTPFRYIRVSDFEDMSINVNTVQYVTKDVRNKIKDYIITKEDVYLSIAGTIGKAGTVPEELDKSNLTENAARLIIKNKGILDKTYLAFCLNSPYVQKIIENFTKIVGQPKLALFRIKEIQIPLAPLPEQKRIVAYLDQISEKQKTLLKIYADIDNQITVLKQSILTKAFK